MSNSYLVITHDGKECHFKTTIKAFDPEAKVSPKEEKFLVETSKLSIEDIKGFTSVSSVSTAMPDRWQIWVDQGIGKETKSHIFTPPSPPTFSIENFVTILQNNMTVGNISPDAEIKIIDHVDHVIVGHKTPIILSEFIDHYVNSVKRSVNHVPTNTVKVEYFVSPRSFILNWGKHPATGFSTPTGARGNAMFYVLNIDMTDPKCVILTVR